LNIRIHGNFFILLLSLFSILSQLSHYYNYKKNIKPSYLKLFEMISGLVSPQSIGLTNEAEVYKIIKRSKMLFQLCHVICVIVIPSLSFTILIIMLRLKYPIKYILIFGIPYSFIWCYCFYYIYNIIISQLIYFHIMCYYLNSKIRSTNKIISITFSNYRRIRQIKVCNILQNLNSIYSEIAEYNDVYWAKFLFLVWILLAVIISCLLYSTIFMKTNIIIRLAFVYGSIMFIIIKLFIINTASSVNKEANKTYKLLNSCIKSNSYKMLSNLMQLKVRIIV